MSELERARAHLRECQLSLLWERKHARPIDGVPHNEHEGRCQERVLAALSWLWEAQANEALHNVERCTYPGHVHRMHEMFGSDLARLALPS